MQLTINLRAPLGTQIKESTKATTISGGVSAAIEFLKRVEKEATDFQKDTWSQIEVIVER